MLQLAEPQSLTDILESIYKKVPPLWPLKDYVAVNPFLGFSDQSFLSAREAITRVRSCETLMEASYYRELIEKRVVTVEDLTKSLEHCVKEYPNFYSSLSLEEIHHCLHAGSCDRFHERSYHTVAEAIDQKSGTAWTQAIVEDISRHCGAHYDAGQAIWRSPWKELPVYQAWREFMLVSRKFEKLGIPNFREFVASLPREPELAIVSLLESLNVHRDHWENFLLCEISSIAGWASYVRCLVSGADTVMPRQNDLIGLLAIRLAFDGALADAGLLDSHGSCLPNKSDDAAFLFSANEDSAVPPSTDVLVRYAVQVASEIAYRRPLCQALLSSSTQDRASVEPLAQMVFCIDVRSEVIRRHLEAVTPEIQTYGFAGFFGLPLQYVSLGEDDGSAQCPVLLKPVFSIQESIDGPLQPKTLGALSRRAAIRLSRGVWQSFQQSATSCFTFVESLGWSYAVSLIKSTLRRSKSAEYARFDGVSSCQHKSLGPYIDTEALPVQKRVEMAAGILKNLGLMSGHAPLVVLCGHGSQTVNNPYRAGLDCGACGGHSGESNARVGALLLNQPDVRQGLAERGMPIKDHVRFIAALHNTTTDEITFYETEGLSGEILDVFNRLQDWTKAASLNCRLERSLRLDHKSSAELMMNARDWSEVRPEWGLAGNAAFVVAPRSRTAALKLDGRVFMHSYEYENDPDGKVLELIMTAPMIVTNWINLQYYASTVDNAAYGSGNKVLHNVVGRVGVLEGNGGDLMTGLPWQSIHDGKQYQHEPLRLSVFIDAPREKIEQVISQHSLVRDLVSNGWLTLLALENDRVFQFFADGEWEEAFAAK